MNRITYLIAAAAIGFMPLSGVAQEFRRVTSFNLPANFPPALPLDLSASGNVNGQVGGVTDGVDFVFGTVSGGPNILNPFPAALVSNDPSDTTGRERAYEVAFDSTGILPDVEGNTFFVAEINSFSGGFFGDGLRTGGAPGADDPANWQVSVDVRARGAVIDPNRVLDVEFEYFDQNHDEFFDHDGDGRVGAVPEGGVDGTATYILRGIPLADDPTDDLFTTNTFRLSDFTPETNAIIDNPATPDIDETIPVFNEDGGFSTFFDFSSGLFGPDANNAIAIDNIIIEFIAPEGVEGDYNGDGFVGGADYTLARDFLGQATTLLNEGDGITPDSVTAEDIAFIGSQFGAPDAGTGSALSSTSVVPEPASAVLVVTTGMLGLCFRRRR